MKCLPYFTQLESDVAVVSGLASVELQLQQLVSLVVLVVVREEFERCIGDGAEEFQVPS